MKLFLFEHIEYLTTNYHQDGGLVIVAADPDAARERFAAYASTARGEYSQGDEPIQITPEEWGAVKVFELAGDYEPSLTVFPDAGCC